ncbi:hypothetical protein CY35_16G025800 [Sphagnum magellanicum]|nr:hypothetical protein CY35_16G025800 [Sphagnum magellanicum]
MVGWLLACLLARPRATLSLEQFVPCKKTSARQKESEAEQTALQNATKTRPLKKQRRSFPHCTVPDSRAELSHHLEVSY